MITISPTIANVKEALLFFFACMDVARPREMRLTPAEAELLVEFLTLPTKFRYYRFASPAKKVVMRSLSISLANLNNKIYSLIDKGLIYRDEDRVLYLNKTLEAASSSIISNFTSSKNSSITFNITPSEDKERADQGLRGLDREDFQSAENSSSTGKAGSSSPI